MPLPSVEARDTSEVTGNEDSYSDMSHTATSDLLSGSSIVRTISEIHPEDSASSPGAHPGNTQRIHLDQMGRGGQDSSDPGIASLVTSVHEHLYRIISGRAFTSQSDLYALPADDEEHARLDMQHFAYSLRMNSLYPFQDLVNSLLREGQEVPPQVLDVGAGSGRWLVDMAHAFPYAKFIGMDLVPPALVSPYNIPDNCRFEIDDMNLTMEHYSNTFNLVHARNVSGGLNDVDSFFFEIARTLKAGGALVVGKGQVQYYQDNYDPCSWIEPGQPGFCWTQYIVGHVYRAFVHRSCHGENTDSYWKGWLEDNPNFSEVREEVVYIPVGPWKQGLNEREQLAANLMRENTARMFRAFHRLLLDDGHLEEDIDHWTTEATNELRNLTTRIYFRVKWYAAIRGAGPWEARQMQTLPSDFGTKSLIKGLDLWKPWVRPQSS